MVVSLAGVRGTVAPASAGDQKAHDPLGRHPDSEGTLGLLTQRVVGRIMVDEAVIQGPLAYTSDPKSYLYTARWYRDRIL